MRTAERQAERLALLLRSRLDEEAFEQRAGWTYEPVALFDAVKTP